MDRAKHWGEIGVIGCGGVVAGTGLAIVAVLLVVVGVLWVTGKSPTERALAGVRAYIPSGSAVRVTSCRLALADADYDVYRCRVVAPRCNRSYLFGVEKDASFYAIGPWSVSADALSKPCAFPSDRRLRGERSP